MADNRTERTYRVIQLGAPRGPNGIQFNESVEHFDDLVTHHPRSNRNAEMQEGVIVRGEPGRALGYIDGKMQEIEVARAGRTFGLKPDQVLEKKDFILEDPNHPSMSGAARAVDVPSPIAGYVGRVSEREGLVDILDRPDGDVIARIRHMHPIAVTQGETVEFGQALGKQGRQQTGAVHVHMEMDTRYHRQFENYVADLVSGRLPVQAELRANVQPLPAVDDGTFRLGQYSESIRNLQRVMAGEGYRAAGGGPLDQDGVYRLGMQGALLDFQRAHGVPQTGDIDPATLRMAPPVATRESDRSDTFRLGRPNPTPTAPDARAPGHPDHRQNLTDPLPAPVNRPGRGRRAGLDESDERMLEQLRGEVRGLDRQAGKSWDDNSERLAASALVMAKERGFTEGDDLRLAFNMPTERYAGGELLHMARLGSTASADPTANRAMMPTHEALSLSPQERYQQVEAVTQTQAEQLILAQQQALARGPDDPSRRGPTMSM
jgi:hypothetical protein